MNLNVSFLLYEITLKHDDNLEIYTDGVYCGVRRSVGQSTAYNFVY